MDRIGYPLSCGDVCSIMHQENVLSSAKQSAQSK
jgi:hypothetical protein